MENGRIDFQCNSGSFHGPPWFWKDWYTSIDAGAYILTIDEDVVWSGVNVELRIDEFNLVRNDETWCTKMVHHNLKNLFLKATLVWIWIEHFHKLKSNHNEEAMYSSKQQPPLATTRIQDKFTIWTSGQTVPYFRQHHEEQKCIVALLKIFNHSSSSWDDS